MSDEKPLEHTTIIGSLSEERARTALYRNLLVKALERLKRGRLPEEDWHREVQALLRQDGWL